MQTVIEYEKLQGITSPEFYADGSLKECILDELNEIETPYGTQVPQYRDASLRRKYIKSISFYPGNKLKSIALQEQTGIQTPAGLFPAELMTFYESGRIKRLFPLNGKLTGYWTEENEAELARDFEFQFPFGTIKKKVIGIQFYESGKIKSLTFWPKQSITVQSPIGETDIRIGLSVYENGAVESFEPNKPITVVTPIGCINAYDTEAISLNGDINSVRFDANGALCAIVTSTDRIEITDSFKNTVTFEPGLKPNLFNHEVMDIVPLKIEFYDGKVRFNGRVENEYDIEDCIFEIDHFAQSVRNQCGDCASCAACG